MNCEEYVLKELDETKDELKNIELRLAMYRDEMRAVGYVIDALVKRMELRTYGKSRVISINDIWENEHDFQTVYNYFKNLLGWEEKESGEQSETCEPAES